MFRCSQCQPGTQKKKLFKAEGYWIYECSKCSHQFADVQTNAEHADSVYGDDYFVGGKAGYPDYVRDASLLTKRGIYYGKVLQKYMPPGSILDIGAAAGFILKGFTQCGWQGIGVEPNARMSAFATNEVGVDVRHGTIEDLEIDRQFDLVSMIQVLPHFYDLNKGLERVAALTKPGGYWLIETWNKDSRTARFLKSAWHEYSPPSVLHWFSPKTIAFFGGALGMKVIARGRPTKKISGAHAKSLISYKIENKPVDKVIRPLLRLIPEKLNIPYPAEDLFWILLQKQSVHSNHKSVFADGKE